MSNTDLFARIQEFVAVTPSTKSYSKSTIRVYGHWLRNFAGWVGTEPTLDDFNETRLREFRNARLTERDYCRTTLCGMYAAFHSFAAWLISEGQLQRDPADILGKTKPSKPKRDNIISAEEGYGMIDACARYTDSYRQTLARAILCTFIHGGLRKGELLNLEMEDVFLSAGYVLIRHGKGDKQREAYLCEEALNALTDYLALRPKKAQSSRLFVLNEQLQVAYGTLVNIIKETWAMAGYNQKRRVTCHSFRHVWVTMLLTRGGDLATVALLAGHSSPAITATIYHNPSSAHLRAVAALSARPVTPPPATPTPPGQASDLPPLRFSYHDESA